MRIITLIGLAVTLAACGDDEADPTGPSTVAGTYSLTTVDGQVLPFTVIDLGAYRAKLASGTLALKSDGTYSFQIGIRIEDSGTIRTQTDDDAGVWNATGSTAVTLTSTEANFSRSGTVSGGALTLQSGPAVFSLRKQSKGRAAAHVRAGR